jgi:predicted nucleotidyltransferase
MTAHPWQITEKKVQAAVQRIVELSRPLSVILFGSYVRGEVGPHSDLDVLVVAEDSLESCRAESVRIRKGLKGILMPMDIIVVRSRDLKKFANVPGLVYSRILAEGKIVYERAA